jgi:hypothetical protein
MAVFEGFAKNLKKHLRKRAFSLPASIFRGFIFFGHTKKMNATVTEKPMG